MSILIKGMDMPKSCVECYVAWERCHRTVEWYKDNPQYYDIRPEDCPLVELVNCDECRFYGHYFYNTPGGCPLDSDNLDDLDGFFCANGERRESE